ncbi:MAG: aldehyde ferredoxin oxidoreductase C-terminal domain-containing protein, partial [Bacillota bacterium]|nr:aldehyde ferredoxin oxidoreductase C-terminal domain-containing protein [Bacillota bacterium]
AGNTIRAQIDHRSPAGQEEISRRAQWVAALIDSLGLCIFIGAAIGPRLELLAALISAHTGAKVTEKELLELGRKIVGQERQFNKAAGFTSVHDRLPEHFLCEISPSAQTMFDVTEAQLSSVHGD